MWPNNSNEGHQLEKDEMGQKVVGSNLIACQFYTYELSVYGPTSYNICWSIECTNDLIVSKMGHMPWSDINGRDCWLGRMFSAHYLTKDEAI